MTREKAIFALDTLYGECIVNNPDRHWSENTAQLFAEALSLGIDALNARNTGNWIQKTLPGSLDYHEYVCSACGATFCADMKYCGCCGARMVGKQ